MSFKRLIVLVFILAVSIITSSALAAGEACINWPKVMAENELARMQGDKIFVLKPLTNATQLGDDDWLSRGIGDYLKDIFLASGDIKALSGNTLNHAGQVTPDFVISGMFQHVAGNLRVFFTITDGKTNELLKQMEVVFPYPENRDFFTKLADAAKDIMKLAKTSAGSGATSRIRDATSSTRAYQSYSKGRQALESYDIQKVELASTWFGEAKRIDYRSPLGYLGMIDLHTFLGLYRKQIGEPFTIYFENAEKEFVEMRRLAKRPPPVFSDIDVKKYKKAGIENRFMLGNIAYMEGIAAMRTQDFQSAAECFRRSTELVPEDSISWYYLADSLLKSGDSGASADAMKKARSMNACLK